MFKRLLIPSLILAVTVPVMAQRVRNPQRQANPRIERALKARRGVVTRGLKALDPTADQLNQWKALQEGNKAQREGIQQEMRQKRQALQQLRSQANPDATQLGNAMLALRESQKRTQQLQEQTLESIKRTLTTDQLKKLEELQTRRPKRRGV